MSQFFMHFSLFSSLHLTIYVVLLLYMVKIIKLKAKTKLGEQKIRHHGDTFHVEHCLMGKIISSIKAKWERLIMDNDEHFDVVEEIEVQ